MSPSSIVILTGAGISAESGIKTFRDQGGLWENHRIEDVATPEGFQRDPKLVHEFYNARRRLLPAVKPNAAHEALARLEAAWQGDFYLVTQNVDDLHDRAGSKKLLHMHGELLKARCEKSHKIFEWQRDLSKDLHCPCCESAGALRPHIVWFGEMPFEMEKIYAALENADIFIAIGTSSQVYPAAGFVQATRPKCRRIEINLTQTDLSGAYDEHLTGPATDLVPKLVSRLLETNRT